MKVIVLSGSPKGDLSVTLQYVNFIAKKFPAHAFQTYHVGEQIQKIARDEVAFQRLADDIAASDAVIWAFPVYTSLVPAQYMRFIELVFEKGAASFRGKYAVSICTSARFYDHTALNYLHAVCDDLGMNYWGGYSADMNDLMKEEERRRLLLFAEDFFRAAEQRMTTAQTYQPLVWSKFKYKPGAPSEKIANPGKRILVLTDLVDPGSNLGRMINRFRDSFDDGVEVINMNDIDIRGGCLGCMQCGFDNTCVYKGKDGFIDFFEEKYVTADMVVYAPVLKGRSYSWRWKLLNDRGFYRGHTPSMRGKQMLFIVSGPLQRMANLRQIFFAIPELSHANLAGIITDECEDSAMIDRLLQESAARMMWADEHGFIRPPTFLAVGGYKIFRDLVWSLRSVTQADYRYYRRNKMFDFPQKDKHAKALNAMLGPLMKDPVTRAELQKNLKKEMVRPHQEVVATK